MVTALVSPLPGPLATVCGLLTWFPARAMLLVVEELGALPQVNEPLPMPGWPTVALLYGVIGMAYGAARWWPAARAQFRAFRARALVPSPLDRATPRWLPLAWGIVCGATLGGWVLLLGG